MNVYDTTLGNLKRAIIAMCVKKGWGDNGIQNPQHVIMAMTVEACEVLEHFETGDLEGVGEEMADVMMYGLQAAHSLNQDISSLINCGMSDDNTPICDIMKSAGQTSVGINRLAMRLMMRAGDMLEEVQWLNDKDVENMLAGGMIDKRSEIGKSFSELFSEILRLSAVLNIDIASEIERKIEIVLKRKSRASEPVR